MYMHMTKCLVGKVAINYGLKQNTQERGKGLSIVFAHL